MNIPTISTNILTSKKMTNGWGVGVAGMVCGDCPHLCLCTTAIHLQLEFLCHQAKRTCPRKYNQRFCILTPQITVRRPPQFLRVGKAAGNWAYYSVMCIFRCLSYATWFLISSVGATLIPQMILLICT